MSLLSAVVLSLFAPGTVHGTVRAESTAEPIGYATVEVVDLERRTAANARGYYVLPGLPDGRWQLRVRALGYQSREVEVRIRDDGSVRLDVTLEPRPVELPELAVETTAEGPGAADVAGPPAVRVRGETLSLVPGLAEADVFRALQALPSVAAASDFSSALYVRGGSPDQNLITLDGAPLFNPYHLGGLFAAFDPEAVSSVEVRSGAFPASEGDRLSSAIAVRTRDGGRDRIRGRGAVGLISSRASLDGPLPGGRGSYLVSLRRTYLDLFTDAAYALELTDFTVPYAFTDAHVKITRDVGGTGSVSAAVYLDDEGVHMPERRGEAAGDDASFDWGSRAASIRYRQPLGPTLLGRLRVAWSDFYGSFDAWTRRYCPSTGCGSGEPVRERALEADSRMRDALVGADLTWYHPAHQLRAGVQVDDYALEHGVVTARDLDGLVPEFQREGGVRTTAAYVVDEWTPTESLGLRAGVRLLHAPGRGSVWLPRLGGRISLTPRFTLSLGAGRYAQVLRSLRNTESLASSLTAYDLLDLVPREVGFSTARDVVLGAEWATRSTNVRVDAYLKRMDGLPVPPVPNDIFNASPLAVDSVRIGSGTSRGLEVYARHVRDGAEFSLSYALLRADRRVGAERFPPRFERRHSVNTTAALPLGDDGTASARLAWATGQPYTPAVGVIEPIAHEPGTGRWWGGYRRILVGEHNSARLPGYFRLDVAARRSFDARWFGADLTITPYLQIINVLNTKNVLVGLPSAYGFTGKPEVEYAPQLPILPTFGVEWEF